MTKGLCSGRRRRSAEVSVLTMDEKGKVLRSVEKLKRGTLLRTRLANGERESQVLRVRPPIPQANARLMHRDSYCRGCDEASRQHRRHRKNWAPPANRRLPATGVANGDLSRQAAKQELRCAQITRQKKNGPANRQARSNLELMPDVTARLAGLPRPQD